ncbi:N-acetylmuramoyl-L-alanine amidase [candidate division KSB1 bacterium]|nr:N-acetylmuramoyl-L-alanine amidase [candidate division KSB1 bacterium]
MRICIDPGHGGSDWGANINNPIRYNEKSFNLALGLLITQKLHQLGHVVLLTRDVDSAVPLETRAQMANNFQADMFISLHANASMSPYTEGMETFYFTGSEAGRSLANLVLRNMLDECYGHLNRGIKTANFTVLRLTQMPATLVECEFMTNPQQAQFLRDPVNQNRLATGIVRGIQVYSR